MFGDTGRDRWSAQRTATRPLFALAKAAYELKMTIEIVQMERDGFLVDLAFGNVQNEHGGLIN
jgi:hypothetical protein